MFTFKLTKFEFDCDMKTILNIYLVYKNWAKKIKQEVANILHTKTHTDVLK